MRLTNVKAFGDFAVFRDYKGQLYSYGVGLPTVRRDNRLRRVVIRDERRRRPFIEDYSVGERHVLAIDGMKSLQSKPRAVRMGFLQRRRTRR